MTTDEELIAYLCESFRNTPWRERAISLGFPEPKCLSLAEFEVAISTSTPPTMPDDIASALSGLGIE